MIRNPKEIERAKREHRRNNPLTIEQKFALMNAMYAEVQQLGRLKTKSAPDRIGHKIEMARILNSRV